MSAKSIPVPEISLLVTVSSSDYLYMTINVMHGKQFCTWHCIHVHNNDVNYAYKLLNNCPLTYSTRGKKVNTLHPSHVRICVHT